MKSNSRSNKSYYGKFTIYFLLFGGLVAILTSTVNYKLNYANIEEQVRSKFKLEKQFKQELLFNFVTHVENQIEALVNNPLMQEFTLSGSESDHSALNNLFLASSSANNNFMQVRFLNSKGLEVVRVDRRKEQRDPAVVPSNALQDKSNRYYFQKASKLPPGVFWYSNVDLNREGGKIELPIRPTFRVAMPVFAKNNFSGLVIINLEVDIILRTLGISSDFDIYIVDKDGEFILSPDKHSSWSRYLPDRKNLLEQFPNWGKEILITDGLSENMIFAFSLETYFKNREGLRTLLVPKPELMQHLETTNLLAALLIALIVIVVSFPLSWLIALAPAKLQGELNGAFEKIQKYTEILDRNVIVSTTDAKGVITSVSSAFLNAAGFSIKELIGQNHNILRHPDSSGTQYEDFWTTISQGKIWRGEFKNLRKDGTSFWLKTVVTPEYDKMGAIQGYTGICQDISAHKEIEKLSITDRLTGLNNRRRLDEFLAAECNRSQRYGDHFNVILLDIDHFKSVNDTYGHQAGDRVLVDLATILKESMRMTDCIGRWGGEEFLIVCPETSSQAAIAMAEKLRNKIEVHDFRGVGNITSSFGVAQFHSGQSISNLISRADKALYRAKEEGRNRVVEAE